MPTETVDDVMIHTDWALLAQQKLALLSMHVTRDQGRAIDGLLNWIDAIQDAAENDGYPVVWLESEKGE